MSKMTKEAPAPSPSTSQAPSVSNPRGTFVTEAAAAGDAVALRRMLAGPNPNARDSNGVPALCLAAAEGHVEAVEALLEGWACVHVKGPGLRTPLHEAAEKGHVDVVRRLLEAGSEVEIKDAQGSNPLMLAMKGGHCETVKVMIRHKKPWYVYVYLALSYAKNASVVRAFEEALPGIIRKEGGKAMRDAAACGRLESIVALLQAGVGIDIGIDIEGYTVLMCASLYGHVECVKELVRRGALLDKCDTWGETALHCASDFGHEEVVRVLLYAGADANIRGSRGTPLDLAKTEAIKNILKKHPTHWA